MKLKERLQAQDQNRQNGLPELVGGSDHILMAEPIRCDLFNEIEKEISFRVDLRQKLKNEGKVPSPEIEIALEGCCDIKESFYHQTDPIWYIENRDRAMIFLINDAIKAIDRRNCSEQSTE